MESFPYNYNCHVCYQNFRINGIIMEKTCQCKFDICDKCIDKLIIDKEFKCLYCKTLIQTLNWRSELGILKEKLENILKKTNVLFEEFLDLRKDEYDYNDKNEIIGRNLIKYHNLPQEEKIRRKNKQKELIKSFKKLTKEQSIIEKKIYKLI